MCCAADNSSRTLITLTACKLENVHMHETALKSLRHLRVRLERQYLWRRRRRRKRRRYCPLCKRRNVNKKSYTEVGKCVRRGSGRVSERGRERH
uniref:Uncharacterized protein n=1 Tax=Anguilla anguilla TaxID=7936 RepID=A0A0E9WPJ6_ANGAN